MAVYYNENDPFKAAWLRELIQHEVIAPGEVDERSIIDVRRSDLTGFSQHHFFAGIGIWSYGLRLAGWPDARPVWTGSCPCQPFSAAGKRNGFADERHLWPAFAWLIAEFQPECIFGEQVASLDGLAWLDVVSANLETLEYAIGPVVIPAAGVGAPEQRHRIFFVAEPDKGRWRLKRGNGLSGARVSNVDGCGAIGSVGIATEDRFEKQSIARRSVCTDGCQSEHEHSDFDAEHSMSTGDLGHTCAAGLPHGKPEKLLGTKRRRQRRAATESSEALVSADRRLRSPQQRTVTGKQGVLQPESDPLTGFWAGAEWIHCRPEPKYPEGRFRPVEPGTFPLAYGAAARVGRLRGYGDGIVAPCAQAFIEAYLSLSNQSSQ